MKKDSINNYPKWAKWIATDADGACWVFEHHPHEHQKGWYENELGRYKKVTQLNPNINWRQSLQQITIDYDQ